MDLVVQSVKDGVEATIDRLFPKQALIRLMDVAPALGMAVQTARNLHHHGQLPFPVSRLGGIVVVARHDLVAFLVGLHGCCPPVTGKKRGRPRKVDQIIARMARSSDRAAE